MLEQHALGIQVVLARQTGAPVLVVNNDGEPAKQLSVNFEVANSSSKAVKKLRLGWRIAAASFCKETTLKPEWAEWEASFAEEPLKDGETKAISAPEAMSKEGATQALLERMKATMAWDVVVTVGVLGVTYTDGSTWTDEAVSKTHIWDGGEAEDAALEVGTSLV